MPAGRRILITGASGFAGRHLLKTLKTEFPGHELVPYGGPGCAEFPQVDITDKAAVREAVAAARPDLIVHLAGLADVAAASADPYMAMLVNAGGTQHVVEAALERAPSALLLAISSSEVYGDSLASGKPVPETTALRPETAYARSKTSAEDAVRAGIDRGLHALIARPFNHTGPGQSTAFVAPAFAAQIAAIEAGTQAPVMRVGWLDDVRDFSDVRDIVRGYALMLANGRQLPSGSVLNLASGRGRTIRSLLEALKAMSSVRFNVEGDPRRQRASRLPAMVGDPALASLVLGWKGRIPFETTLADVLAEARTKAVAS